MLQTWLLEVVLVELLVVWLALNGHLTYVGLQHDQIKLLVLRELVWWIFLKFVDRVMERFPLQILNISLNVPAIWLLFGS